MKPRKKTNWRPKLETLEARRLLSVYADFNGDGFDDLAIGVPGEDSGAGIVQVLYGSGTGLTATGSQTWGQTILGTDVSEAGDNFGAALAAGDYNNDGRSDLAVGVPGEDIGAATDAGLVHFILGSPTGLTGAGDYVMHQDINRVRDIAETGDFFGKALAAGDFDNDGFDDLGVGLPGQDIPGKADAGGVHIFYGGGQGIKPPGNQTFNLDSPAMAGTAAVGDQYGTALAAGDFNGDGRSDLAIGIPFADFNSDVDEGMFSTIFGSASGLTPAGSQNQSALTVAGARAGTSLAVGDFNSDGRDDLVVGAPFCDVGSATAAGLIAEFHGTATGLVHKTGHQEHNISSGLVAEANDNMGAALASGDFNADGFDDVVIGVPGEETGAVANIGQGLLLIGNATGLVQTPNPALTQAGAGATPGADDHFSETLGVGNFDGAGGFDIAIGTPDDDVGLVIDAGTVYVGYALGGAGSQTWNQNSAGIADTSETADGFGGGLDANGGKSAPGGGTGRQDLAHLLTADVDSDTPINKLNKRRQLGGRR